MQKPKGGKRAGAGRKSREAQGLEPLVSITIRLTPSTIARVHAEKERLGLTHEELFQKKFKKV